ncbi:MULTISPECIES: dicarboxylate/amino acid:cation symporter [Capnocytophaga]|uniref:Dicarboxylate/amino acid:cation symporter n=1 Tax=Capnocytophaga canis TaxID=1848903 RepID=A0A0B7IUW5_9FLAO|nr:MULTISPECIES: dicarboxylate/amino acid:cation symporter [Capnocytophaga]ATA72289.1 dicarboxylate/amino acid:cation symporter [Capnocytophaga sp. H4358]ATA75962.1 dicarboxylate/amino acid:cation symporter [Capnocytophaga sp. H2931]RIY37712.1 dicarboxylate/amino acid:cation symporter [Capnocytophaga canis]CEN43051.1 Glutamate-aspartate carrier protein [Capnocytophaga canis]CEN53708.1 Glutamate-aspartate carrier protein [Capnocytophaga canis]
MKDKKKLALHWQIFIGMVAGGLLGLLMLQFSWGKDAVLDFVKPFGNMFIKSLKIIALPLILASLIKGIADLKDISKISSIGMRTIILYLSTTVLAVSIGLMVANIIKPGDMLTEETRTELTREYQTQANTSIEVAHNKQREARPLDPIENLIPDNLFLSATNNSNMLQIIFCAMLFGFAMIMIPEEKTKPVKAFFDSLNDIILKIIDLIMKVAPFGVFALIASLIVEVPNAEMLSALLVYALAVVIGLTIMMGVYGLLVWTFTKKTPKFFFKNLAPVQLLAFSTSSSSATLPLTMETVEKKLGVDEEVASFVIPLGATVNMDGTSLYLGIAALFIAQAFGMDLSFSAQLGIVATATLASIGTAGVPGASIAMLVIILEQAGIPESGLALILAVDRPLDMLRTVANVTGDACVTMIVGKSVGKLHEPEE